METKVNPDAARRDGTTALFFAAQYGYTHIAELLLTYGAQPDLIRVDGTTPLLFASFYGHAAIVALLLAAGADKAIAYNGLRAFDWAIQNEHINVIAVFLGNASPTRSIVASARLLSVARRGQVREVELLIDQDLDENAVERAFYVASKRGQSEVVELLLRRQIDHKFITTILCHAARYGQASVVEVLLKWVRPNDSVLNDKTALYYAAEYGHVDVVRLLIHDGADFRSFSH